MYVAKIRTLVGITWNFKANKTKCINSNYCATYITSIKNTLLLRHTLHPSSVKAKLTYAVQPIHRDVQGRAF